MKTLIDEMGAAWKFMGAGFRRIEHTASIFPSSRFLVDTMVSQAPLEHAHCVVEFGPGTGAVTRAILDAMPRTAHLHAIELDGELLQTLTTRIADPRLRPIHGDATRAVELIHGANCWHGATAVFSSLGLALMKDSLRAAILREASALLAPDGTFMQYQYLHAIPLAYQFGQGFAPFNGQSFLQGHFRQVDRHFVFANLPPAAVYTCRGVLAPRQLTRVRKPVVRTQRRRRVAGSRR